MSSFSGSGNPTAVFTLASSITFTGLSTLADAGTVTSNAINNSAFRFPEMLININLAGTAAATAWLDVRMLASTDAGLTYQEFNNGFVLPPLALIVTPTIYQARVLCPEYFKITIKNNTGAALTAGTVFWQGVRR